VIVLDTSVLSLAFRRRERAGSEPMLVKELRRMISEDWPLAVPGIVVQELLSGVRTRKEFRKPQTHLRGFPALLANEQDHLRAAEIANVCRATDVSCSAIDALIAAQTMAAAGQLFTTDRDFELMAPCCGLQLLAVDDPASA